MRARTKHVELVADASTRVRVTLSGRIFADKSRCGGRRGVEAAPIQLAVVERFVERRSIERTQTGHYAMPLGAHDADARIVTVCERRKMMMCMYE